MLQSPSRTALLSAAARAAHREVDAAPYLLVDAQAPRLLEALGTEPLDYHRRFPHEPVLTGARVSTLLRSRFAEDQLRASTAHQYVVLGAGLDTSAFRAPRELDVFEVDLPGVLAWRRWAFSAAGLMSPGRVREVGFSLGTQPLLPALVDAGFDQRSPAFVSWMGTTMYLDDDEIGSTINELAGLAPGSEIVADHILPPELRDDAGAAYADAIAAMAGGVGEPWRSTPAPEVLRTTLADAGFTSITTLVDADVVDATQWSRTDHLRPWRLVGLVHARLA